MAPKKSEHFEVSKKVPLEMISEKQKIYVKGEWLSIEEVSIKYGKPITTTPLGILEWLREKEEPVNFYGLIKEFNLNKNTAYSMIRKLEAKGLIVRIGKRNPLIGLTEKGYKLLVPELIEIDRKLTKKETLTFKNIETILKFIDKLEYFDLILNILDKDIKLRNEKFNVDCIKDLYFGQELLPEEMRVARPKENDVKELIKEKLRAIVLHEYRRLYRLTTFEFINGKISYEECMKKTEDYDRNAINLFPRYIR
jgi:predicted transcriptional regulator